MCKNNSLQLIYGQWPVLCVMLHDLYLYFVLVMLNFVALNFLCLQVTGELEPQAANGGSAAELSDLLQDPHFVVREYMTQIIFERDTVLETAIFTVLCSKLEVTGPGDEGGEGSSIPNISYMLVRDAMKGMVFKQFIVK